jgi:hypothetical protein
MDRLFHKWISLMMVFQKHLEGALWQPQHFCKLIHRYVRLFRLKHTRVLRFFKFFHFLDILRTIDP